MTKITPDHLARGAFVYIRQSTADQVSHNLESKRRQYGLAERARQLGWQDVEVIDDDLGRSGGGIVRPGFEKLLAAICTGRVGAVMSVEASRLARNGRDWHTLLEFCGLVGTLIVDEDGVYDPRSPNDRLLLGMKGTMSEMELSVFRQRSMEAMKQKARRGELFLTVAVGYVKTGNDRIEKDADLRVQEAIALVFRKFAEVQTVRQVLVWLRQEKISLPAMVPSAEVRPIEWRLPVYTTLHHMLTNPIYAGAYAFGRRTMRVTIENGRKRVQRTMQRDWREWSVLIRDHHEGYLTWAEYERNLSLISDNANGKSYLGRGSIRRGEALLPGLFRCARCGRKLYVSYSGSSHAGHQTQRYACRGAFSQVAAASCIAFGGMRVDRMVAKEVIDRLQPLGVEAALAAIDARGKARSDKAQQLDFALQHARYEAVRAQRQYDVIDPDNRLVASELERRWNERLTAVRTLEADVEELSAKQDHVLTAADRERLMALGKDLSRAWDSPGATSETRKKIIRTLVSEIVVDVVGDHLDLIIHWQGGDHTRLTIKKNRGGQTRWSTDANVIDLVRVLARQMPDDLIAAVLNRGGKSTGRGNSWTRARICTLRSQQKIAIYREGERAERGEATLDEAAVALAVSPSTIRRLMACGVLPAHQLCKGAPWIILQGDLSRDDVRRSADARRSRRPPSDDRQQNRLDL
jgi:DNA invertase Pin-like site-specific DNA recombinase